MLRKAVDALPGERRLSAAVFACPAVKTTAEARVVVAQTTVTARHVAQVARLAGAALLAVVFLAFAVRFVHVGLRVVVGRAPPWCDRK